MDYKKTIEQMIADGVIPQEAVEKYCPELVESEDDKIRAFLVDFIKVCKWTEKEDQGWPTKDACVDWLEKQGEQKLTNIVTILDDYFANTSKEQQDKDWEELKHLNNFGWKLVGQKPAEWSDEDEKIITEIINDIECAKAVNYHAPKENYEFRQNWLKSLKSRVKPQPKQEWCKDDEELRALAIENLSELKQRYGEDYGKVGKCIDLLENIKNRILPIQPQREWSEESKKMLDAIYSCVDSHYDGLAKTSLLIWLKSLRPQNRWKPSEEQLDALETAAASLQSNALVSLHSKLINL